ncbi:17-beta-hydroxysteroid dehydrogenase 13-like [Culicoides brevitarsis]|uniref:17-beta-hydroxysteroid dehydrogenase 13-like n=1 Tax=Culicoides brevitarsis TaxID=469753 RepID=UPI00307C4B62
MNVIEENSTSKWVSYSQHILGILIISTFAYFFIIKRFSRVTKCISGKVALVTGGGSGLGAAISLQLAKQGCNLAIVDLNLEAAQRNATHLRKLGVKAEAYKADVSNLAEIEAIKTRIEQDLGKVGIIVNNAAMLFTKCIETESPEKLQKMLKVNILSVIWTSRVFLSSMIEEGFGHIVTICSVAGLIGMPVGLPYVTTKFAVRGFMEALAMDIFYRGHAKKVKTTTVYPSFISTNNEVVKVYNDAVNRKFFNSLYTPETVAKKVVDAIRNDQETLVIPGFAKIIGYGLTVPLIIRKFLGGFMVHKGYAWNGFTTDVKQSTSTEL